MTAYFDAYAYTLSSIERGLAHLDAQSDGLLPHARPRNGLDLPGPWDIAVRVDVVDGRPRAWIWPLDYLVWVEQQVVRDVTLCAEWPGCPVLIRDAVHELVLRWAPNSQPPGVAGPDYEDEAAQARGLGRMVDALHSVFHDLAHCGVEGFSDDPRAPVWALAGAGDGRRAVMRPVPLDYWVKQVRFAGLDPDEDFPMFAAVGQQARDHALYCDKTMDEADAERDHVVRVLRGVAREGRTT